MTKKDFDVWLSHHCSRFTGIASWLAKFPAKGDGVSQASILSGWYLAVSGLTLANACWASDRMFTDEAKPRSFDDHPSRIVALNRTKSAEADELRGPSGLDKCICEGTGLVEVANFGEFVLADGTPNPSRWVSVACRCSVGQWLNGRRKASNQGHPLPVYDAGTMRLGKDVRHEEAVVWMQDKGIQSMPSRAELSRMFQGIGQIPGVDASLVQVGGGL